MKSLSDSDFTCLSVNFKNTFVFNLFSIHERVECKAMVLI